MSLSQFKTLVIGVLKGWFANKQILDKFDESENGTLLYDGSEITGSSSDNTITDEQVQQTIAEILNELKDEEGE